MAETAENTHYLFCPACGKKMEKLFMEEQNVYLDVCLNGCGGIFFDSKEFRMFNQSSDDIKALIEAYKDRKFEKNNTEIKKICPVCGSKMVKNYIGGKAARVQVDDCYMCGGKFLYYEGLCTVRNMEKLRRYAKKSVSFDENHYKEMEESGFTDNSGSQAHFSENGGKTVIYEKNIKKIIISSVLTGAAAGFIPAFIFKDRLYEYLTPFFKNYNLWLTGKEFLCIILIASALIGAFFGFLHAASRLRRMK